MTKEEFFEKIEQKINDTNLHIAFCEPIYCDDCLFLHKKYKNCLMTEKITIKDNTIVFRNKNILREYEKYKAEMLIEKLK